MKKVYLLLVISLIVLVGCGNTENVSEDKTIETIVFGDAQWDSFAFHNSVASTIVEHGYGYDTEVISGSTAATFQGLREGDINVYMELWVDNLQEIYDEGTEAGDIETVSINYDDNEQGLYVPTYVIEGDSERGIEPMAPDLRSIEDLKDYPELFQDAEDSSKGRIIGGPTGWVVSEQMETKIETYGLDEMYNYFYPGSEAGLITSLADAYESGEAWVGYYWSPTGITAKYDLTLLEEPEYDKEIFQKNYGTAFPPVDVVIAVHKDLPDQAPEVVEFLSNYQTSNALTEDALRYIVENDASPEEAAHWWMGEHEDVWINWVPEDVAEKVMNFLK
ncbi:ABC transporter substrate-binding protein [Aquibacillus halophilus]|uniref:ABC transporter substrate-binding protein n=1 Tax=Aquibacillus halophilus TaxID=930132 RepID=A0A6A8DMA7_9BACI|nr:ABC transporter substrate-binding protein [Aquibacillus halophilus]MRH44941.1 ABC transporter substrate-binding protein [Aquibacillus halophilus]